MRTIVILFLGILIQGRISGQSVLSPSTEVKSGNNAPCALMYTGDKWTVAHSDTAHHQCSVLVIKSLPPHSKISTVMNPFISMRGSYTLKKDPSLVIPDDCTVILEDMLTGQYFNLKTQDSYVFNITRGFNQPRFSIEVSQGISKSAVGAK